MSYIVIETLWTAVCNGDLNTLHKYYENGGETKRRYYAFAKEYSLLMGAYSTDNFEVVDYLLSVGETLTEDEQSEFRLRLKRLKYLEILANVHTEE